MVVGDIATTADLVILGAGPGGYVAAIRAAQLGKEVVLIDPGRPGGVCLHQGCIPAKALLTAADNAGQFADLSAMGITTGEMRIDLTKMQSWKSNVVAKLVRGVEQLLAHHEVDFISGIGWFLGENELRVEAEYGTKRFLFDKCVIAVGVEAAPLPQLAFDGERVLTPSQALNLTDLPEKIGVIGSDYIAIELATFFAKLNVAVQLLIPTGQRLLAEFDPAAGRQVEARLKKLGVKTETKVTQLTAAVEGLPKVVVSVGSIPRTEKLHLEKAGVQTDEQGFIRVNDCMQTSQPSIYAVGDVTGGPPLANIAMKQGKVAAEHLAGQPAQYSPQAVPRVAWIDPQVATVGLTAAEAEAAGYRVVTSRFPLAANGRALTLQTTQGFVQVVAEHDSQVLLGVIIVGPEAETLIGEACLALEMGATLTDLAETLHPHPSLGEMLQEAAEAALGMAIHIKNPSER
jgi:dihydrolipoamide dehydrogenase